MFLILLLYFSANAYKYVRAEFYGRLLAVRDPRAPRPAKPRPREWLIPTQSALGEHRHCEEREQGLHVSHLLYLF
jgi:hypothetical protein